MTSASGAIVQYNVTAVDDFDGPVAADSSPPSGSTFPLGNTTVTCTATDQAGNTANAEFVVTVQDTTPPETQIISAKEGNNFTIPLQNGSTPSNKIILEFNGSDAVGISWL